MPTHVKEGPALLLQADDSELFGWVEEKLEAIGLDGKLYTRVIKSVLRANLEEEEFELNVEHKRVSCHELINEILLASMWKGNDKTDDYWIFREVISDFVNKYKSRSALSDTDAASSNELESSDERYEEAFPSLSNACDEIAWNIPRWTCMVERSLVGRDVTSLQAGDDNDHGMDIFQMERGSMWNKRFRSRRHRRRASAITRSSNDNTTNVFKRHSIPNGDGTPSTGNFMGEFHPCKTVGQSKRSRWRGRLRHSESNAALLMSDGDDTGSATSQVSTSSQDTTRYKFETMQPVSLKLLFPNLNISNNINNYRHITNNKSYCNNININSNSFYCNGLNEDENSGVCHEYSDCETGFRVKKCVQWSDDDLIFDLLTFPFMSDQSPVCQELKSLIPDYPWSSPENYWIPIEERTNNVQHKGSKLDDDDDDDDIIDSIINEHNINVDDDDDYGMVMKNYPQSPLPYFHPDPPSYALFPWRAGFKGGGWMED